MSSSSPTDRDGASAPEFGVPVGQAVYGTVEAEDSHTGPEARGVPASHGLRLMAVHAHPDDESSKGAAMMAAYEEAGAEVMVVTCTGGERGDLLNPSYGDTVRLDRDITGVRRTEMDEAGAALGIEHRWLGFMDSGLPEGDPLPPLPSGCFATVPLEQATAPLVRVIREFQPHVLVSYDEIGGYPHPDHIKSHQVTVEAYRAAGDPERFPGVGEPWTPSKLYYDRAFNPDKYRALHEAYLAAGKESPFTERMAWYEKLRAEGQAEREAAEREAARAEAALEAAEREQTGREETGREETGREETGREEAGHKEAGHKEAGHKEAGREEAGHKEAGREEAAGEPAPAQPRPPRFRITDHRVTTQIDVADYLERRDAALRAHRTQVDPAGAFFAAPNALLRRTWPWEDYVLIDSRVETTLPETDLFTGLR